MLKDDSMVNAGIINGDIIIVKEQSYAFDGDIVVALVGDDEATTKTYHLEGKNTRLQPENDSMEPIILPSNEIKILGKVTALIRRIK